MYMYCIYSQFYIQLVDVLVDEWKTNLGINLLQLNDRLTTKNDLVWYISLNLARKTGSTHHILVHPHGPILICQIWSWTVYYLQNLDQDQFLLQYS